MNPKLFTRPIVQASNITMEHGSNMKGQMVLFTSV